MNSRTATPLIVYLLERKGKYISIWDDGGKYLKVHFQKKGEAQDINQAYTYNRDKAQAMWQEKVLEGWNRVG